MSRILLIIACFFALMSCNDKNTLNGGGAPEPEPPIPPIVDKSDSVLNQLRYFDIDAMTNAIRTTSVEVLSNCGGDIILDTINTTGERVVVAEMEMGGTKSLSYYCFLRSDTLEHIFTYTNFEDLVQLKSIDKIKYLKNLSNKIFDCISSKDYYTYSLGSLDYYPALAEVASADIVMPFSNDVRIEISELKRSKFWTSVDKWIAENKAYDGRFGFMEYNSFSNDYDQYKPTANQCTNDYKIIAGENLLSFTISRMLYTSETEANKISGLELMKIYNAVSAKYEDRFSN